MYKDKIDDTNKELEKVRKAINEYSALEQRLLGRLVTLQELQTDEDAVAANADQK